MRFTRTFLSAIFLLGLLGSVLIGSLTLALLKREAERLPVITSLENPKAALTTKLVARDGSEMGRFAEKNGQNIDLKAVPPLLIQAFISSEDRSFWKHQGIDPFAIARAGLFDIRNRGSGRRPLGASTISQQLVKNLFNGDRDNLKRKIDEAMMAIRIERDFGKERVIEAYLNNIYLGQGAYGIYIASQIYFGKSLQDLNLAEMAFLAGLPKGPSNYDPVRHPEASRFRRLYVLNRMLEDGAITAEQAKTANDAPLPHPEAKSLGGIAEGWFAEDVRREIVSGLGSAALYKGGLLVKTSMDPRLQAFAEKSLRDGLIDYDRRHGWRGALAHFNLSGTNASQWLSDLQNTDLPAGIDDWQSAIVLGFRDGAVLGFRDGHTQTLTLEGVKWARRHIKDSVGPIPRRLEDVVSTGDIILVETIQDNGKTRLELRQVPTLQGSVTVVENKTGRVLATAGGFSYEQGSFDRSVQSKRQPGSTFKPFIYLTAFENGYEPSSPVMDVPISIEVAPGMPRWKPEGEGSLGLITARRALEESRNFASVRLLYDLGIESVSETAIRFGLYDTPLSNYSAALGSMETSPLKITEAYAAIANGGWLVAPGFVDSVEDSKGNVIWKREEVHQDDSTRLAPALQIAQLTSVLQGVVSRGTAAPVLGKMSLPIAGKTGTTNNNLDAWFVGFTPDFTVGVHVGFDKPEPLGSNETGGAAASPIFGSFVKSALSLYPPSTPGFVIPDGLEVVKIDPITGELSKNGSLEIVPAKK